MQFRNRRSGSEGGFEPLDGVSRKKRRRGGGDGDLRKVYQLCAQVRETLGFALAERWDDPLIERLSVVSVVPAPNAGRLRVTVALDPAGERVEAKVIIALLKRLRGVLRREIAAEIYRKKTPELTFDLAPMGTEPHVQAPTEHG